MPFNTGAVVVAALSSFLLGGLWYSPLLFQKAWIRAAGVSELKQDKHPAHVFGFSFVFALISAAVFAVFIGPNPPLSFAVQRGVMAGAGLVAANLGVNFLFSNRTWALWAIDAGYHVVQFALFGLVLGLWH